METASSGRTAVVLTHLSERGIEALPAAAGGLGYHGVASGWWAVMMEDPFKSVRDQVRSELDMSASINNSELMARIEEMVWRRRELMELTAAEKRRLVRRVFDSFRGLDVLQPLVDNPRITEIMINSHQDIFIEQDGEVKKLPLNSNRRAAWRISFRALSVR